MSKDVQMYHGKVKARKVMRAFVDLQSSEGRTRADKCNVLSEGRQNSRPLSSDFMVEWLLEPRDAPVFC